MLQHAISDEKITPKSVKPAETAPDKQRIIRTRISEDECTEKIDKASRQIEISIEKLKTFKDDLEAFKNKEFYNRLRIISNQYFILSKHIVNLTSVEMLRKSNAATIMRLNGIEICVDFLEVFIGDILRHGPSEDVEYTIFRSVEKLMIILMNYSDVSIDFGVKLCENDRFLRLYQRVLEKYISASTEETLSDNNSKILRYALSTVYNLLLFENETNIEKIREWKFFDVVQPLLHSKNERLKLNASFLTVYLINEEDASMFKTDQSAIDYLLKLLKQSLKTHNKRSTGFSSLELAKAVNKLAKNDETKKILVDLGILPIIKQVVDHKSYSLQLKEVVISILWDLAFDERYREIISQMMLTDLESMNSILDREPTKALETTKIPTKNIEQNETENDKPNDDIEDPSVYENNNLRDVSLFESSAFGAVSDNLFAQAGNELRLDNSRPPPRPLTTPTIASASSDANVSTKPTVEPVLDDNAIENEEDDVKPTQIEEKQMRMTCRKTLDGLMWTLKDSHSKRPKHRSKKENQYATANFETPDSEPIRENHVMFSYCWSNEEIVMKIYNSLKEKGYTLWIDKKNMAETDNIMEAMASAVENSYAVIICISKSYKDSKNCRAEANYAYQKDKHLIPIMVQPRYRPDGWLGITISGLQYIDFAGRFDFETAQEKLIYKLNQDLEKEVDKVDHVQTKKTTLTETSETGYSTWSNTEVNDWLKKLELTFYRWPSNCDGAELQFLKTLQSRAPDSFMQLCKTEISIDNLKDLRIFYQSIKKL